MRGKQLIPGVKVNDLRLYHTWMDMKSRCYDKNVEAYRFYGARGIKICHEWRNNFMAFYNWALANGYQEHLTIDRIDSGGDYSPENCQWLTRSDNAKRQHRNTRNGVCKRGHILNEENIYIYGSGQIACKTCVRNNRRALNPSIK